RGGMLARWGCTSTGVERVSARPGSISASFGAGRLASTLASAARARASNDFSPRGSFSATLVSVFVCLRGGNAFASFPALRAGGADLDELHEETREVGILARHGNPPEGTVGNSNGRLRANSGRQPRGKVTILRKKFSPLASRLGRPGGWRGQRARRLRRSRRGA